MTRQVWKFPLVINDLTSIEMPAGSRVLTVVNQNENVCLYALVDPEATNVRKVFRVAGTDHPIEAFVSYKNYVGTVLLKSGSLVFHVFELE